VEAVDPQELARCVRALWWTIEAEIGGSEVSLDDVTARMMRLLGRQVRIREQMPVRHSYQCRDCRLEKVIDLPPGSSVFGPGGRLLTIRDLDPDYACSRCHGSEADESLATICPGCGAVIKDPVLSACTSTGCLMDFRVFLAHSRSARIAYPLQGASADM
jgi:hypothetical protein